MQLTANEHRCRDKKYFDENLNVEILAICIPDHRLILDSH